VTGASLPTGDAPVNVAGLHRRAVERFGILVSTVGADQWHLPTPCAEWDVRELVAHLVYENLWTPELFAGKTIAEVGERFDGDRLGEDPVGAWRRAQGPAITAVGAPGAMEREVELSFGRVPGAEYAAQLFADHLIHEWDLATAIGEDPTLERDMVAACTEWFRPREDLYRMVGAVGPRPDLPDEAEPQEVLLAMFGRSG
jgi:uncharacterized protein (TIGR03086 family)